jgi:hypothetical protein
VCSKKSEWPLHRQKPRPIITAVVTVEQARKKKKKRNKDRMCGLKMSLAGPRQKQEKVPSPDVPPTVTIEDTTPANQTTTPKIANKQNNPSTSNPVKPKLTNQTTTPKILNKQNNSSTSHPTKPKVVPKKLNQIQTNSKNRNNKPLNKNVLKNMISKASIKSSLKDFLNSLS